MKRGEIIFEVFVTFVTVVPERPTCGVGNNYGS